MRHPSPQEHVETSAPLLPSLVVTETDAPEPPAILDASGRPVRAPPQHRPIGFVHWPA